jgi:hypothetical protein
MAYQQSSLQRSASLRANFRLKVNSVKGNYCHVRVTHAFCQLRQLRRRGLNLKPLGMAPLPWEWRPCPIPA